MTVSNEIVYFAEMAQRPTVATNAHNIELLAKDVKHAKDVVK